MTKDIQGNPMQANSSERNRPEASSDGQEDNVGVIEENSKRTENRQSPEREEMSPTEIF